MTTARLLLVEDDAAIAEPLCRGLVNHGYEVKSAGSASDAREQARATPPDLVLLDLGLPDLDGVVLCRELRKMLPQAVIVILTARDAEVDVVVGLEAGADDYLVKPFRFGELLARLRAHLRRQDVLARADGDASFVEAGPVTIDLRARRVTIGPHEVELRPKEFDLLAILVANAGRAVTREELMAKVWDENWYGSTKTLDMHIGMLRRRLDECGLDPGLISTVRGYGYRFESDGQR